MKKKKITGDKVLIVSFYLLLGIMSVICIFPIVFAVIGSFTSEAEVANHGFSLIPDALSLETYKYVFQTQGGKLLNAYKVSLINTFAGTFLSVVVTVCYAYVISVKGFKHSSKLAFFAYFTMLFNGGMMAWYLICTKYLGLKDNMLAMILPYTMNVFNMYLMRNFIKGLPYELLESAKIDGAGHFRILGQIILPLSKAGIVTISLFYALQYWNDFYLPLMLINNEKYYSIQYILYKMMSNIQFLASNPSSSLASHVVLPAQTIKMAITCIAIGPIILVYPFIQKHFVKGVTVGALKG
ncbi:putative aldouronate transport system permease protein [Anaerocolumna jejuensis DSM 15929]|uniref:Putative aldouronate transport system permease protein n=1 Tax=Anaerocolumna jejuensis DSM 15929 TaxID=1121322 RepID=A0A1M6W9D5_9FIRM|nr:carbohydrate ABC transporter permease [Anaerocolumna jejuensis]SHK90373.1 putative aldouronate transport system permease protein [Anaerocolumna jejuensis DSM 15929]